MQGGGGFIDEAQVKRFPKAITVVISPGCSKAKNGKNETAGKK